MLLLASVMMMLITELLGNSPWEEAGKSGRGGEALGMERSLAVLAALLGSGNRAQSVGKAVAMLGWVGEAMAQALRKVGCGWRPLCGLTAFCWGWEGLGHRGASSLLGHDAKVLLACLHWGWCGIWDAQSCQSLQAVVWEQLWGEPHVVVFSPCCSSSLCIRARSLCL